MIVLKSPPITARRVLHLNCPSKSPGGKDYVLVELVNGQLWACNGPAFTVRNGGGAVQHPKKTWREMISEKAGKGYIEEGEYRNGIWWSGIMGHTYKDVPNIPIKPDDISPDPEPPPKVAPQPRKQDLAEQYPVSDLSRSWGPNADEWFFALS